MVHSLLFCKGFLAFLYWISFLLLLLLHLYVLSYFLESHFYLFSISFWADHYTNVLRVIQVLLLCFWLKPIHLSSVGDAFFLHIFYWLMLNGCCFHSPIFLKYYTYSRAWFWIHFVFECLKLFISNFFLLMFFPSVLHSLLPGGDRYQPQHLSPLHSLLIASIFNSSCCNAYDFLTLEYESAG